MLFIILFLIVISFIGIKPQKNKSDYLNRNVTISVTGIFAVIIFCSHFFGYIDESSLNILDKPLYLLTTILGQLMVSPFLFFSGYGVFESFKKKGDEYANTMPKNRVLKLYLSFLVAWIFFASVSLFFRTNYSLQDYIFSLIGLKTIGNSNWYVVVIVVLYIISYIAFTISNGDKKKAFLIHAFLIPLLYIVIYRLASGSWWYNTLFCYLFGVSYSYFKNKIDSCLSKKRTSGFLFLAVSVVGFAVSYFAYHKLPIPVLGHFFYMAVNLFFCLSIVSFLYLFQIKNKILLFLGTNCFWIYILQRLPMVVFSHSSLIFGNRYVFFIACFVSTLILALFVSKAFSYVWNIVFLRKGDVGEVTNIKVGIVISYVTLALSILGAFIVTPLLLEMLGDVQYGLRSFATSITTWLTVISSALSASYLRFINKANEKDGIGEGKTNALYTKIFLFVSLGILTITIVGVLACYSFNVSFGNYSDSENKLIILLLLISGINLAIQIAYSTFTHYLTYKKEFIFIRGLSLLTTFAMFALELVFVFLTKSVIAVSLVALFITAVSAVSTVVFATRGRKMAFQKEKIGDDNSVLKAIIAFSSFVLLNAIVDQINQQVDITILGFLTNAENVTTYTLSRYFIVYMGSLSVAISATYAPKVHEYVKNNDIVGVNDLFRRVSRAQLIVLLFVVGGFAACGHSFVRIWLGDSKEYVFYYSLVLLSLNVIPLSCNLGIEVQRAMNKHKFRAILYIIIALLNVAISIILIASLPRDLSIWAAIFGTVFSIVLGNIIILNLYNHFSIGLNMKRYFITAAKYLVMASLAVTPTIFVSLLFGSSLSNVLLFLINGTIFSVIYIAELLVIDHKTAVPFIKKAIARLAK